VIVVVAALGALTAAIAFPRRTRQQIELEPALSTPRSSNNRLTTLTEMRHTSNGGPRRTLLPVPPFADVRQVVSRLPPFANSRWMRMGFATRRGCSRSRRCRPGRIVRTLT
jgi:hypothetical protein